MKKCIALLLVLVSVLCLFAGCGASSDEIVLPKQDVEETTENRQNALLATAWAFYNKNPYVQYDCEGLTRAGRGLGIRNASNMNNTPEMAGPQRTIFHVCSFYTYITTFHTFDYKSLGGWADHWISPLATGSDAASKQFIAFQVSLNDLTDEEKLQKMDELRAFLQPGDMIYYLRNEAAGGSSHTVIWMGDYDGDGDQDMINVDGNYYDDVAMEEVREAKGGVDINTDRWNCPSAEQFFFDPGAYDYFPKLKHLAVVRYTDEKHAEELPITERAKTRMLFPGLVIFFEAEKGIYGSVPQGGEYTYTLTLKNVSEQDHEGLLIQLPVPANAEIVKVNGESAKNKTVKFNVDLPASQEVAITYTVKPTGNVGDVITTGVGYVHAIPLPSLNTVITSGEVDAASVKAALEENKGKTGDEFLAAYLKSMNYALTIPTADDIRSALFDRKNLGDFKLNMPKAAEDIADGDKILSQMRIPEFFGGQTIATDIESLRVKELRNEDLQAGDVLIWRQDKLSDPMVAVHNGESLMVPVNGQMVAMTQYDLDRFIMYDFFIALRPTQVL